MINFLPTKWLLEEDWGTCLGTWLNTHRVLTFPLRSPSQTLRHLESEPTVPVPWKLKGRSFAALQSRSKPSTWASFILTLQPLNCCAGFSDDSALSTSWAAGCPHALARIRNGQLAQEEGLTYLFFPQMT